MNESKQPRNRFLAIRRRVAGGSLALAIALLPAVVATISAQAQTFTLLYSFTGGSDGANPYARVVRDSKGNLYGTTVNGGNPGCYVGAGCGTVFKLDATGKETVLYSFTGGADGANPSGGLARVQGDLYGATPLGGATGHGTVFKLDTAGKEAGKETVLHSFTGAGGGGSTPATGGVVRDVKGNLYGTTAFGGAYGNGTVYKLDTTGKETVLYSFTGGADGAVPRGELVLAHGNLYGTANRGGDLGCSGGGCGTVFKLDR